MAVRGLTVAVCLGALVSASCTQEVAGPPAEGSWVEILEMEVSPDALAVEDLAAFRAVEVLPDRLVFTFDGGSPLRVGHVVGASAGDRMYLRRIVELHELAGGRVEAMTELAALQEFYPTLRFIVHYRPRRTSSSTRGEGDVGGAVMSATEECAPDTAPCDLTGGASVDADTAGCSTTSEQSLTFAPFVETDFDADFEFDHGIGVDWGWSPDVELEPDLVTIFDGSIRTGVRFKATAAASLSCQADFAALAGGGTAPEVVLVRGVVPGPLPIPWEVKATPIFDGQMTANADVGELSAEAWVEARGRTEFGVRDGDLVYEPSFGVGGDAGVVTARGGALSANGSITAGVRLTLGIGWEGGFDTHGVSGEIALKGEASMALTGTLGMNLTTEDAGCAWSADFPWQAQAQLGVSFDVNAEGEVGRFDFSVPEWSYDYTWDPYVIDSGSLGTFGGTFAWCEMQPVTCGEGAAACHDDYYDNTVCAGMQGSRACDGGQYQRCTCTAEGWVDCGACMPAG